MIKKIFLFSLLSLTLFSADFTDDEEFQLIYNRYKPIMEWSDVGVHPVPLDNKIACIQELEAFNKVFRSIFSNNEWPYRPKQLIPEEQAFLIQFHTMVMENIRKNYSNDLWGNLKSLSYKINNDDVVNTKHPHRVHIINNESKRVYTFTYVDGFEKVKERLEFLK